MKTTWISNLKTPEQKEKFKEDLRNKLLHDPVIERLREILENTSDQVIAELIKEPKDTEVKVGELRALKFIELLLERPKEK